jgi:hypothetical protein
MQEIAKLVEDYWRPSNSRSQLSSPYIPKILGIQLQTINAA